MNPWRGLAGLPRGLWVVCATVLINRSGTMVLPFLALYLTGERGFSPAEAGLTITLYGLGALVIAPIAGWLCDRLGAQRIMEWSLLLAGGLMLLYPHVEGKHAIMAMTPALAILGEAFRPASMALLSDLAPKDKLKAAFALNRLAVNLGMSIGPAVGGFLAMWSFATLFYVDGATSILAGLVFAVTGRTSAATPGAVHSVAHPAPGAPSQRLLAGFSDKRLLFFLGAMIPVLIVFFQHQATMPLYLVRDAGMTTAAYGLLFTINTGLIIFLEVPLNLAMAGWPHRRALPLGAFLTAAGFGALAVTSSAWGVAATVVLWTFGEMILLPGSSAYVAEIAPPRRRGEYMGFYSMSFSVSFASGPALGARIYERFGGMVLWCAVFLCGCLSAAMLTRIPEEPPGTTAGSSPT